MQESNNNWLSFAVKQIVFFKISINNLHAGGNSVMVLVAHVPRDFCSGLHKQLREICAELF